MCFACEIRAINMMREQYIARARERMRAEAVDEPAAEEAPAAGEAAPQAKAEDDGPSIELKQ